MHGLDGRGGNSDIEDVDILVIFCLLLAASGLAALFAGLAIGLDN